MMIITFLYYLLSLKIISCLSSQINKKDNFDDSKLRYVAFGTSVTFGSTVNPEKEAYIKVISPTSVNLGIRASDPSYPAICTQSMVGDAKYDVIVVEYERRYEMGLAALVKRLRKRFVDATIIVTNVWTFMNVNVVDDNGNRLLPFREWLARNGFETNTPEARHFVKNSNVKFAFNTFRLSKRDLYMNTLVKDYNVRIFGWNTHTDNIKALLIRFLPLYAIDFIHWSSTGHKFAADGIKRIVHAERTKFSNRVGSWGEGDVCDKWLSRGVLKENVASDGKMEQFDDRWGGKFALQFESRGFIKIENPFDGPREFSLTYMTTGPAPSIYPKTKISIKSSGQIPIVVDPTDTFYDYPVHVQMSQVIGKVNPGINTILIHPLEKREKPFRLVGYSITNASRKISKMWTKPFDDGVAI